jgi:hypothetical protein
MSQDLNNMTQPQAVGLLLQAAKLAQSRGAYDLNEAAMLSHAVALLEPKETVSEQDSEEEAPQETKEE